MPDAFGFRPAWTRMNQLLGSLAPELVAAWEGTLPDPSGGITQVPIPP